MLHQLGHVWSMSGGQKNENDENPNFFMLVLNQVCSKMEIWFWNYFVFLIFSVSELILQEKNLFLIFIGPRYTWGPIYGSESLKLSIPCWDLNDVTLADEDSIQFKAMRQCKWCRFMQLNLQLMQVAPSGGQICNLCKWRHLVAKFATYASGAN